MGRENDKVREKKTEREECEGRFLGRREGEKGRGEIIREGKIREGRGRGRNYGNGKEGVEWYGM